MNYSSNIRTKSVPTGLLFHRISLIILLVILFVALVQNLYSFTMIISLILALAFMAKTMSLAILFNVKCRLTLKQKHFFPLDSAAVNIEIANSKFIPLFWARVVVFLPRGIALGENKAIDGHSSTPELEFDFSLNAWHAARFSPRVVCLRRGYYPLKKLTLSSGDLFGLYRQTTEFACDEALVVYPRLYPMKDLAIFSLYPTCGIAFKEQLFHDHTRTMGVRDYCTSDEFRHIHWKASARRERLQVKVFEPTTMGQMALFLPREEFRDEEELEKAISVLAVIAHKAVEQGNSVGFFSNCSLTDSGKPAAVIPDSNKNNMNVLLESFAKIGSKANCSWEIFFSSISKELRRGTTLVFAAAQFEAAVCRSLLSLRQAGYKVIVVHPGSRKDNPLQGEVSIYKYALQNGYIQCDPQQ